MPRFKQVEQLVWVTVGSSCRGEFGPGLCGPGLCEPAVMRRAAAFTRGLFLSCPWRLESAAACELVQSWFWIWVVRGPTTGA